MKNFLSIFWNKAINHLFEFYDIINSDFKSRLLFYLIPTFAVLTLVALMILPVGVPIIGSTTGFFWNTEYNHEFIGQVNKWFWYRKSILTFVFLVFLGVGVWTWRKLLFSRAKSASLALLLSYVTFVGTPIWTQYFVMGDWDKFSRVTLADGHGKPSYFVYATRIDNVFDYLSHHDEFLRVETKSDWKLDAKPIGFLLTFYAFDKLNLLLNDALGLSTLSLQERAFLTGLDFLLITALCLFPMYFVARKMYSKEIALIGVMIFSLVPIIPYNFGSDYNWNYFILMPLTVLVLLFLIYWRDQRSWLMASISLLIILFGCLLNWAFLSLLGFWFIYIAVHLRWGIVYNAREMVKQGLRISIIMVVVLMSAAGLIYLLTGINILLHFWDQFIIAAFVDRSGFKHSLANVLAGSPINYLVGLPLSMFEFFFWCGIPLSLQLVLSFIKSIKPDLQGNQKLMSDRLTVIVFIVFLVFLDISGMHFDTRRIWSFLAPVLLIASLYEFKTIKKEKVIISAGLIIYIFLGFQVLVCRSVFDYKGFF